MGFILTILLLCVLSAPRVIAETTKSGFINSPESARHEVILWMPPWHRATGLKEATTRSTLLRARPGRSRRELLLAHSGAPGLLGIVRISTGKSFITGQYF